MEGRGVDAAAVARALAHVGELQPSLLAPPLTQADVAARCEKSEHYRLFRDVLQYDVEPQPHLELAELLDRALGDYTFPGSAQHLYGIGWPRGTFKTSCVAEGVPCIGVGKNPNIRTLVTSFRHDVGKRRMRAVKRRLESSAPFHAYFGSGWKPEFREEQWADDAIVVMRRTDTSLIDPTVATGGVDRSLTGGHFDLIIADDVVVDTNSRTRDARDKVYSYILDLLPILEPGGVLIVIFTRWHVDDAYGRLFRQDQDRQRRDLAPFFEWTIHKAHNPDGSLFFPARLTEEFLRDQRARMGSRKYEAQYNNCPLAPEDKTFLMDFARVRSFNFVPSVSGGGTVIVPAVGQSNVLATIAWDPAGRKPSGQSDSHGITVVGCDPQARWWVLEAVGVKAPPLQIIDRMCNLVVYYHPHTVSCEDVLAQGLWLDLLAKELDRRNIERPAFYEWQTGSIPKNERIANILQPRWERGEIVLHKKQADLFRQFEDFSVSETQAHDDILDSLVQHDRIIRVAPMYGIERAENPVDAEYLERKARLAREGETTGVSGGMHGTQWDVTPSGADSFLYSDVQVP